MPVASQVRSRPNRTRMTFDMPLRDLRDAEVVQDFLSKQILVPSSSESASRQRDFVVYVAS